MDILRELAGGDRRSIGKADGVVALILKTPALLDDVVSGFLHPDPVIRMRCADVAEKVSVAHPEWLQPHKEALLSFANTVQEKEIRWHMAQMLPRLQLSAVERRRAVALLFGSLDDPSQIVKTCSMQALFDMSRSDSKLRARVIPILRDAVRNGSPAARSRAKRLLTAIDRALVAPADGPDAV
jgi:hypothetical protein